MVRKTAAYVRRDSVALFSALSHKSWTCPDGDCSFVTWVTLPGDYKQCPQFETRYNQPLFEALVAQMRKHWEKDHFKPKRRRA